MTVWVSRVLLGICAATAVVGGAALVVMVIVYFAANTYVPELQEGGYGILAGILGFGIYVGGAFRGHIVARIAAGIGLALASSLLTVIVAYLISLTVDPGGERGNLEEGTAGAIWLLMGAYFAWRVFTCRWPVRQKRVAAPSGEDEGECSAA
ncbi:hypothetical protein ABN028_09985 [Actinopolymorpha sp. B17G11]|uniref:hypothetical protein n=1 Tax=Actinopolymorpha sp. B17G11 TaxID=3160861 RepID=UPI0032E41E1C